MYTPQDQAALYGVGAAYMANATPTIRRMCMTKLIVIIIIFLIVVMQGQPTAGPLASPTGLVSHTH